MRRNADHTIGGPYPLHAPPTDEYMRPPKQHFGTPINDYPAMSLHLINLQQGPQAMSNTLRRHEQWQHHIDDGFSNTSIGTMRQINSLGSCMRDSSTCKLD
jgi:hypothetical protein